MLNRKIALIVACMMLASCAGNSQAIAQIEKDKRLSDLELYEICKADIQKENFEITPCGMFIGGAFGSFEQSKLLLIGLNFELEEKQESILKILHHVAKCNYSALSRRKVGEDYVRYVENHNLKPESKNADSHFWYYFLSCGDLSKLNFD